MGFPACRKSLFHTSEKAFRPHIYYNILIFKTLQNCPQNSHIPRQNVCRHNPCDSQRLHVPLSLTFSPHFLTLSPSHFLTLTSPLHLSSSGPRQPKNCLPSVRICPERRAWCSSPHPKARTCCAAELCLRRLILRLSPLHV